MGRLSPFDFSTWRGNWILCAYFSGGVSCGDVAEEGMVQGGTKIGENVADEQAPFGRELFFHPREALDNEPRVVLRIPTLPVGEVEGIPAPGYA